MKRDFLRVDDLSKDELEKVLDLSAEMKKNPEKYSEEMKRKTLLMIFAKPSLRTRVSFETGMTQMGGHGIYYNIATSPLGKKETIEDTARTVSRYCDGIVARLFAHEDIERLAKSASIPVVNALTDKFHPCQALADFMTIKEKKGTYKVKMAYLGDANNNVTHSLMLASSLLGAEMRIACPQKERYLPAKDVMERCREIGGNIAITENPEEAVREVDVVCTDSWMSYHITEREKDERLRELERFRVTESIMELAREDAIFMHCLPASREMEVEASVIDGEKSVVFDEAENRLHTEKALLKMLIGGM